MQSKLLEAFNNLEHFVLTKGEAVHDGMKYYGLVRRQFDVVNLVEVWGPNTSWVVHRIDDHVKIASIEPEEFIKFSEDFIKKHTIKFVKEGDFFNGQFLPQTADLEYQNAIHSVVYSIQYTILEAITGRTLIKMYKTNDGYAVLVSGKDLSFCQTSDDFEYIHHLAMKEIEYWSTIGIKHSIKS